MACVSFPRAPTSSMSAASSTRPGSRPIAPDEELQRVLPVVEGLARRGVVGLDRHPPCRGGARLPRCRRAHRQRRLGAARRSGPDAAGRRARRAGRADAPPRPARGQVRRSGLRRRRRGGAPLPAASAPRPARPPGSPASASPSIPASASARASQENIALIAGAGRLADAGYPVLIGASRKSFIGRLTGIAEPRRRDPASVWLARRGCPPRRRHRARPRRRRHAARPSRSRRQCDRVARSCHAHLFGTDGVRGRANVSTDDRRDRHAHRHGGGPGLQPRRPSPSRRDRQGHAAVRLHDRAGADRGLPVGRHGRAAARARCRRRPSAS